MIIYDAADGSRQQNKTKEALMKLDIIIPHYKEPWATCCYLFNSIAMQRRIPFENIRCIVVNDGDDESLDSVNFGMFPYEIVYLKKEHGGVSAARNYGLDYSDADYVMWCDIDDGFLNNYALHMIFAAMNEGFDYLNSNFAEETLTEKEGAIVIVGHAADITFMHGKVYRREFLVENNLRFDPEMTIHEDGYFNCVAYLTALKKGKVKKIDTPYYLWCWNGESTVRKNSEDYTLRTYDHVMRARIGIANQLRDRGYEEDYRDSVGMTVLNSYYDFQKTAWTQAKNEKYYKAAEKEFKKFWNLFGKVFYDLTNLKVAEIAKVARENAVKNGMLMEQTDLRTFLKHIENEVKL